MERFQRTKYLTRVSEVRRELSSWVGTYKTMLEGENAQQFTPRQLETADSRQYWLEDLVDKLEEVEEGLSDGPEES